MTDPLFPEPQAAAEPQPCAWCSTPTLERLEVERARWGKTRKDGVRVLKKRAVEAPCCTPCKSRLGMVAA